MYRAASQNTLYVRAIEGQLLCATAPAPHESSLRARARTEPELPDEESGHQIGTPSRPAARGRAVPRESQALKIDRSCQRASVA